AGPPASRYRLRASWRRRLLEESDSFLSGGSGGCKGSAGGLGLPDTNTEAPAGRLPPHFLKAQPAVFRVPQERPAVTRMRRPLGVPRQKCRHARGFDSLPAYLVAQADQALQGGAIPGARRVACETGRYDGREDLADRVVTQPHGPGALARRERLLGLAPLRGEGRGICGGGNDQLSGVSGEQILGRMELEKVSACDVLGPVPRLQQDVAGVSFRYPETCRRRPLQLLQREDLFTEPFRERAADVPAPESEQRHDPVRVGRAHRDGCLRIR